MNMREKFGTRHRSMLAALLGLTLVLAGCGGGEPADDPDPGTGDGTDGEQNEQAELETFTIGMSSALDSFLAEIAEAGAQGAELAVEHVNADGGVADKWELELDVRDDQLNPEQAVASMRSWSESGVNVVIGGMITPICKAASEFAEQNDMVWLHAHCSADEVSGPPWGEKPWSANGFAIASRDSRISGDLGRYIGRNLDVEHFDVFGYDYQVGHELWQRSLEGMQAEGLEPNVNQETWVPLGETAFRPQLSAMSRNLAGDDPAARGLFVSTFGSGTAAFLQQSQPLGLWDDYGLMTGAGAYYEVARSLNGSSPEFLNAYDYHYACVDNDLNDKFVEDYESRFGVKPTTQSFQGYNGVLAIAAALETADSTETADLVEAFKGLEVDGLAGTFTIGAESQQAEQGTMVARLVGNPEAPEGVEFLECEVVEPS